VIQTDRVQGATRQDGGRRALTAYAISAAIGAAYGVILQVLARLRTPEIAGLNLAMSFGFVFIHPFAIGVLTMWFATVEQRRSWLFRIFAPWPVLAVCLAIFMLVGWEGAICLVMVSAIFFPLVSVGGIVGGVLFAANDRQQSASRALCSVLLVLPIVSGWLEERRPLPREHATVRTAIDIDAPADAVWQQIIRVPRIQEPLDGFFYRIGFPKPVEATLSYEGAGGVRHARFEGGLVFIETVDVWEPARRLSFSIISDPASVPPTTLDQHVVVGGRYFDVLRGTYEIEPRGRDRCTLHLSSETRVSTRFNFYAAPWARFLMRDIQSTILTVIKTRAEHGPRHE
jgi:hypothetical protein